MKKLEDLYKKHEESAFNFENYLYRTAEHYSGDYQSGTWSSNTLKSEETDEILDGFYMTMKGDKTYTIRNDQNYYSSGEMDSKTFSLSMWAMALNHFGLFLYERGMEEVAELYFELYHYVQDNCAAILNEEQLKKYSEFLD